MCLREGGRGRIFLSMPECKNGANVGAILRCPDKPSCGSVCFVHRNIQKKSLFTRPTLIFCYTNQSKTLFFYYSRQRERESVCAL